MFFFLRNERVQFIVLYSKNSTRTRFSSSFAFLYDMKYDRNKATRKKFKVEACHVSSQPVSKRKFNVLLLILCSNSRFVGHCRFPWIVRFHILSICHGCVESYNLKADCINKITWSYQQDQTISQTLRKLNTSTQNKVKTSDIKYSEQRVFVRIHHIQAMILRALMLITKTNNTMGFSTCILYVCTSLLYTNKYMWWSNKWKTDACWCHWKWNIIRSMFNS